MNGMNRPINGMNRPIKVGKAPTQFLDKADKAMDTIEHSWVKVADLTI